MDHVSTTLSNYYGTVEFEAQDGSFWMLLENWDDVRRVEVSREFFEAAKQEFARPRDDDGKYVTRS